MAKYVPSVATIDHFVWRYTYLPKEDSKTPQYMFKMVEHYLTADGDTKNIKAFRGSGKSINTCILALDRIANGHNRFVMIVSDTMTQAEALIDDILTLVQDGTLPIVITRAVTGMLEFEVDGKPCAIMGVGAGQSLRGRKFKRLRADLVITDDLVNDASSANKLRRDRLIRWVFKVLKPSMLPGSELWNVGTPLNANDVFGLMTNKYPTLEIPLDEHAWPERFSPEWIENTKQEYKDAGMLAAWKQEMELVLVDDETAIFDVNKVRTIDECDVPDDLTWFITLDGAFSEKSAADYSAFACLGLDGDGRWYVASYDIKDKPQIVIDKLFELQAKYGPNSVGIEKGQFLLSMKYEVEQRQVDYQQYFSIEELSTTGSKIARIKALSPIINSGRLTIIDTGDAAERLIEQIELTSNEGVLSGEDDHIDALCQLIQMDLYHHDSTEVDEDEDEDYNYGIFN